MYYKNSTYLRLADFVFNNLINNAILFLVIEFSYLKESNIFSIFGSIKVLQQNLHLIINKKIMSKFDEKVALYKKFMDDRNLPCNLDLLKAVTKGLGPSIYKKDAETVSGTDAKELETVKKNFLMKKLGLADSPELDKAIDEVVEKIGRSERNKYRAVVYYMLAQKFGKESVYGM